MLDGSWLMAHGSWPREARGDSWLKTENEKRYLLMASLIVN